MNINEVLNVLNFRHACKEFDPNRKINTDDLETIIEGGRLAASSVGIEPWHFIVVENTEFKNELSTTYFSNPKHIANCSAFVILLTRNANEIKSDSKYIDYILKDIKELSGDAYNMHKEFIKSVIGRFKNDTEIQAYANEQTYIALSSMMLSAAMLGIDSCAIGGINKEAVTKLLVEKGLLDTTKFQVTLGCALGYRVNEITPKKRQPLNKVATFIK